jgi:hypothetical protein
MKQVVIQKVLVKNEKVFFPSLNGLRAISIFFVILHHLLIKGQIRENYITDLIPDGQFGVNIFFVISGFLITSLLIKEEINEEKISLKYFYIRRILRIFPAYYFYLFILFILFINKIIYISGFSWFTAIFYLKDFVRYDWYTSHAWSLSVEEQFYLFYPIIFILGNKMRKNINIFFILFPIILKTYIYFHPNLPNFCFNQLSIFYRIDAISFGCILAYYKEFLITLFNKYLKLYFYLSILVISLISSLPFYLNMKLNSNFMFFNFVFLTTYGTVSNLCISVILFYSVFGKKSIWHQILNHKVLNFIGLLSYSIYLWQQFFISDLKYIITSFPFNLIFLFLVSLFSYYVIEKPILKLKDNFKK